MTRSLDILRSRGDGKRKQLNEVAEQVHAGDAVAARLMDSVGQTCEAGVLARFQSITATFPLSHLNSIVVRNPLHAFPWHRSTWAREGTVER